jgi:hypothetical protein
VVGTLVAKLRHEAPVDLHSFAIDQHLVRTRPRGE